MEFVRIKSVNRMTARTTTIVLWTLGVALVGAFLRAKGSYAQTWQGLLRDSYVGILVGACTGKIPGYTFSRRFAPKVKVAPTSVRSSGLPNQVVVRFKARDDTPVQNHHATFCAFYSLGSRQTHY